MPGGSLLKWADRITTVCSVIGTTLIVLIALMLFYEVVARYLFNAPTIWTQDVAVTCQVWFTYLCMNYALRQRQMIRIVAVASKFGPRGRKGLEAFSLLAILAFSIMATVYGIDIVADSIRLGRRQPTMLAMPTWITEVPVALGFALLALQAVADLIRLPFRPAPSFSAETDELPQEDRS